MGRLGGQELIGETAIRPDVDFFCVVDASRNFWRKPRRCTFLAFSILLLFAEEHAKPEVSQLDPAIRRAKDIIGLNVSVEDVLIMHLLYSKSDVKQGPFDEVFFEVSCSALYNVCHRSTVHQVHNNPKSVPEIINFEAVG